MKWTPAQKARHPFVYFPVLAAGMLVYAAADEHGWRFYALLRWVCFGAFLCVALCGMVEKKVLCWIGLAGAMLFNPLFKIHLGREIWIKADVAAALVLLWGAWMAFKTVGPKDE